MMGQEEGGLVAAAAAAVAALACLSAIGWGIWEGPGLWAEEPETS